jgi:hypothetical protein
MPFTDTQIVLNALRAHLEALRFPGDAVVLPGEPVFERVALYDIPNLNQGLQDLLIFEGRVCLVVPMPEEFEDSQQGQVLKTTYTQEFALIVCDQDYGAGTRAAYFGDGDNPGVLAIKHLVARSLVGADFGLPQVVLRLRSAESLRLTGADGLDQSRDGYLITLSTPMGVEKTTLSSAQRINQ